MQYLGGKSRISRPISEVINEIFRRQEQNKQGYFANNKQDVGRERERERVFVSLFCGTCSIESKVNADVKILNDKHEYLIEMFKALQNGYILPDTITEEQYKYIRENKDKDKALSGFVGFGCSFGGKWFGGYARNKTGTNYCLQSKKSLLKDFVGLNNAIFTCLDYKDVKIPENAIVYCDIPYKSTTGYSLGKFDTDEFWCYNRELSKNNIVLTSEQEAPGDFICIWQKEFVRKLDNVNQNRKIVYEKLFIHEKYIDILKRI